MRVTQTVSIQRIEYKGRLPLNVKVLKFAVAKAKGDIFPPISVERIADGKFKLHDGRHRLAAHKLVGAKDVRVSVAISEAPNPFKPLVHGKSIGVKVKHEKLHLTPTAKE